MKLAVSISLTIPSDPGKAALYLRGFRRNAEVLQDIYPGAELVLHHDDTVPADVVALADRAVRWERRDDTGCMFWRFASVGDSDFDAVLVRDADSVVGPRERNAVAQWLASPLPFHTMHDHEAHKPYRVLGGMWGAKRGALPFDFPHLVRWWLQRKGPFQYDSDQWFLTRFIYPYSERGGMNHWGVSPRYLNTLPFPDGPSPAAGYVGERFSGQP